MNDCMRMNHFSVENRAFGYIPKENSKRFIGNVLSRYNIINTIIGAIDIR